MHLRKSHPSQVAASRSAGGHLRIRPAGQAGFTLAEVTISLIIMVQIILIALFLFDFNSRVTRVQTRMAEMQQSLRAAHYEVQRTIRLAGRGSLPVTARQVVGGNGVIPAYWAAVDLANNVTGDDRKIAPNYADTPLAVESTDMLTLRGVMSSSVFDANPVNSITLNDTPADATWGTLQVDSTSPTIGTAQPLDALIQAVTNNVPEALILTSVKREVYAVVELDPANSDVTDPNSVTLRFNIRDTARSNLYRQLWTHDNGAVDGFPTQLERGADYVGILEEYRLYIRDVRETNPLLAYGDGDQELAPRLSRARMLPNTGLPHGDPGSYTAADTLTLQEDLAENILDFQVAMAFDSTFPGGTADDVDGNATESSTGTNDDWLFNHEDDDPTIGVWTVNEDAAPPEFFFLRINLLARTARPDLGYEAEVLDGLEDRSYAGDKYINSDLALQYRRRTLTTTVDLRNLS